MSSTEETDELADWPSFEDADGMSAFSPSVNNLIASGSLDFELNTHVPHMLYQTQGHRLSQEERLRRMSISQAAAPLVSPSIQMNSDPTAFLNPHRSSISKPALPPFVYPLPYRILNDDVEYLQKKGALTVPEPKLRNELLRSYVQYVHPYMPLLDLNDFLSAIERNNGSSAVSLLLFQAVMFAGTAFIDMRFLQAQGFESRKVARKVFFQRARALYDFDYELDRICLVQALLLMTYWYETPDDQKDTWHWMGVSLSLAHTIGLHRNPENSNMDLKRQRLWKRIWWSCFMRDRLIALGMRRPTRIKNEDCDVPLLALEDFEIEAGSAEVVRMLGGCAVIRDPDKRKQLALMCIEKAKLCLCVSQVLASQYSVLSHKLGGTTHTTMMLVPKKSAAETSEVERCDGELERWFEDLPDETRYQKPGSGERVKSTDGNVILVHRALLNMIYFTTSSALHRPQVLPAAPSPEVPADLQELSRRKVRVAATEITEVAKDLHGLDLVRFLPTTGVTTLLPAVIIHLLDIKSNDMTVRNTSLRRFHQCMHVLERLREMYASADFATSFLEAAIRKANIQMPTERSCKVPLGTVEQPRAVPRNGAVLPHDTLTPPPDAYTSASKFLQHSTLAPGESSMFAALTPPWCDGRRNPGLGTTTSTNLNEVLCFEDENEFSLNDFDALINLDAGADLFAAKDGLGVEMDMDWMAGLPEDSAKIGEMGGNGGITGDLDVDLGIQLDD